MKLFDVELSSDLITRWDEHMATFWAPVILGLVFAGLAIKEISQMHVRMFILYVILTLCCVGYLACSGDIIKFISRIVQ